MLDFLTRNWLPVLIGACVLAYLIYLSITKQWVKVREFTYKAMLLAERTFSDADGKIKLDFVVRVVYKFLPVWLRLFVKEKHLENLVQGWYNTAKDFMDDGKINDSIK